MVANPTPANQYTTGREISLVRKRSDAGSPSTRGASLAIARLLSSALDALEARSFYLLGRDELMLLWLEARSRRDREQALSEFARRASSELAPGWTDGTALLTRKAGHDATDPCSDGRC
jgi:hypothetical protein